MKVWVIFESYSTVRQRICQLLYSSFAASCMVGVILNLFIVPELANFCLSKSSFYLLRR